MPQAAATFTPDGAALQAFIWHELIPGPLGQATIDRAVGAKIRQFQQSKAAIAAEERSSLTSYVFKSYVCFLASSKAWNPLTHFPRANYGSAC